MTALCASNGPSRPKFGVGTVQSLTADGIAAILTRYGMTWAAGIGVGLTAYSIIVDDLCSRDPPPLPNIDASWWTGFFSTFPSLSAVGYAHDIESILSHYLWWDLCECVTGPQPPVPPPILQPPNTSLDNPTLTRATGTPCSNRSFVFESQTFDSSGNITWTPQSNANLQTGVQWIELQSSGTFNDFTTVGYPVTHNFEMLNASGATIDRQTWVQTGQVNDDARHIEQFIVPAGAATFRLSSHTDTGAGHEMGMSLQGVQYCSAPPTSLQDPCCPPDPQLLALLGQIYRLEQDILQQLGLTPKYSNGPVHSARTGSASIAISNLRGIRAHVVAGIPSLGQLPGNPPYEWNLGWMSVMTGDGMIEEKRLTRGDQIWLPTSMPLATTFGYYLNPGIVVDFTELVPA